MRVVPTYDIDDEDWLPLDSDPEVDRLDSRTTVVSGEPISGGELDLKDQPEPPLDDDALTVVLRSGDRVRRPGWLRAPQLAVIALLVFGAGISIRVFRRQSGEDHVRGGIVRHGIAEGRAKAARKAVTVSSPVRPQTKDPLRHEARRSQARARPHPMDWDRAVWSTSIERRHALPMPSPSPDNGAASAGSAPHVDDAPPPEFEAGRSVLPGRPPCVPGTLGC